MVDINMLLGEKEENKPVEPKIKQLTEEQQILKLVSLLKDSPDIFTIAMKRKIPYNVIVDEGKGILLKFDPDEMKRKVKKIGLQKTVSDLIKFFEKYETKNLILYILENPVLIEGNVRIYENCGVKYLGVDKGSNTVFCSENNNSLLLFDLLGKTELEQRTLESMYNKTQPKKNIRTLSENVVSTENDIADIEQEEQALLEEHNQTIDSQIDDALSDINDILGKFQ